jgi:hypothetical protein
MSITTSRLDHHIGLFVKRIMGTRLMLGCCALVLSLMAVLSWLHWPSPPKHNISTLGYEQIRLGMTEQEVVTILGVPSGDYGSGQGEILEYGDFTMNSHLIRTDPKGKKWLAGCLAITVCFDEHGRVRAKMTEEVYRPYDSALEGLGQKLGLCQKKPYPPESFNWLFSGK